MWRFYEIMKYVNKLKNSQAVGIMFHVIDTKDYMSLAAEISAEMVLQDIIFCGSFYKLKLKIHTTLYVEILFKVYA